MKNQLRFCGGGRIMMLQWWSIRLLCLLFLTWHCIQAYKVECNTTNDCESRFRIGSICLNTGFCSNPYHHRGCLANSRYITNSETKVDNTPTRICSSSDPPEAKANGSCVAYNDWNYSEIRLMANNWESVFFSTWIVQILLSEILGVPTSVDTGSAGKVVDFYDLEGRIDYGKSYLWDGMRKAQEIGDCRLLKQPTNISEYIPCSHVSLEVWAGTEDDTKLLEIENITEKKSPMGVIGSGGFYVPRFTAERDPTVVTYFGLAGEKNRRKLADRFLRPTKWIDYCTQVSTNNCTIPDTIASRMPTTPEEEVKMFMAGEYTGYFRKTEENECDTFPDNCTGHFIDYPCGWSSYAEQQFYHLDVSLRSSGDEPECRGYSYSQMVDIWAAANATKADVMMKWWEPDALVFAYFGSDAEFQKVSLPIPTQECLDNRVDPMDRCQPNMTLRRGNKEGSCDDITEPLMKIVTRNLYDICHDPSTSFALHSPAYDAIKNFQISGLQLGVIFQRWMEKRKKQTQHDPREQVCEWVAENEDLIRSFIPRSFPRAMIQGEVLSTQPMVYISLVVACLVMILLLSVMLFVYKKRNNRAVAIAQVEFLVLLLAGLSLVQVGSISLAVPPTTFSCVFSTWMINMGYTLELVPLIVKVAAVNRLMEAGKQLKRMHIERLHLFMAVVIVTICVVVYLILWTLIDPLRKGTKYDLTTEVNSSGETIVKYYNCCQSDSAIWSIIANVWRSVLLLSATVLAFQTRNSPVNFNESKTLGIMVYSQFSFLVWSLVIYFVQDALPTTQVQRFMSLIYSADVAVVCCVYFIPKLLKSDSAFSSSNSTSNKSSDGSGVANNATNTDPPMLAPCEAATGEPIDCVVFRSFIDDVKAAELQAPECLNRSLED